MRPVINSEKRIVQTILSTVMADAVAGGVLIQADQTVASTNPRSVAAGSVIKAVFIEMWLLATSQQPSTFTYVIEKLVSDADPIDATEMTNINAYTNKKNIFEIHQGLIGDANANPTGVMRHWIKIPKGKQRFGLGDKLRFTIKAITEDTQFCGMAIYKVYN